MNDDVNDAAWILVHCAQDCADAARDDPEFIPAERSRLYRNARLYCQVFDRYPVTERMVIDV